MSDPTIFALASGSGRSAIAIIRVSGPGSAAMLRSLTGQVSEPRRATLSDIRHPVSGDMLDRGLVLWFAAPHSFTGEDAAELHLHGGRAVVRSVLDALAALDDMRPAEPGEFTRRALRNGKMDLAAVEGLADLIEAETEQQRRQALRQLGGALGRWADGIRTLLVDALVLAEGAIDFAEDDDLLGSFEREVRAHIVSARERVTAQLGAAGRSEMVRDGLVVAITGPPNVGKSTLLNVLSGRDVAIVSEHAGTTRDPIEVALDLGGHAVFLVDTAGLRDTLDPVEQEGVARARARADDADLVLWLHDCPSRPITPAITAPALWTVATKIDTSPMRQAADHAVSARTGEGVDILVDGLASHAASRAAGAETAAVTRLRHRLSLEQAAGHLDAALMLDAGHLELIAEELRAAMRALARLTGAIDTEEVLGGIFARFCIGK